MAQTTTAEYLNVIQTAKQCLQSEDKKGDSSFSYFPYQSKSFTAGLVAGEKIS